jgi:RNA polymerase sigma-70 factor (ECF subfamily)
MFALAARTYPMEAWAALADRQLITLVLRGRPDAYGELVRRHQSAVYNAAYRLVGDRQEALDLAQDTFVRAYSALGSFDTARPFGPWICRIAVNTALNWLQRRRVPTVPLAGGTIDDADQDYIPALADDTSEPERVYLAAESQALLRDAILSLPANYRAVVELRHFQDLSYDEIAAALGIPLSDVKSHLFRARRMLRERLERENEEGA